MPCQDWLAIYFKHISVVNTNAKRLDVSHVFRIALKIVAGIHQDLIEDLVEARYKVDLRIIIVACCHGKNWQSCFFFKPKYGKKNITPEVPTNASSLIIQSESHSKWMRVKFTTFPRHEQLYVSKATASFWTIFCLVSSQTHSLTDFVNPKHRKLQVASKNCTSWNVLQEYEIHEVFWSFKVRHVISLSRPFPLRFDGADVGVWSLPFQSTVSWWRCCEHPFVLVWIFRNSRTNFFLVVWIP